MSNWQLFNNNYKSNKAPKPERRNSNREIDLFLKSKKGLEILEELSAKIIDRLNKPTQNLLAKHKS